MATARTGGGHQRSYQGPPKPATWLPSRRCRVEAGHAGGVRVEGLRSRDRAHCPRDDRSGADAVLGRVAVREAGSTPMTPALPEAYGPGPPRVAGYVVSGKGRATASRLRQEEFAAAEAGRGPARRLAQLGTQRGAKSATGDIPQQGGGHGAGAEAGMEEADARVRAEELECWRSGPVGTERDSPLHPAVSPGGNWAVRARPRKARAVVTVRVPSRGRPRSPPCTDHGCPSVVPHN